jgi:hypothetical protein
MPHPPAAQGWIYRAALRGGAQRLRGDRRAPRARRPRQRPGTLLVLLASPSALQARCAATGRARSAGGRFSTPLHRAAAYGATEAITALLRAGADESMQQENGYAVTRARARVCVGGGGIS